MALGEQFWVTLQESAIFTQEAELAGGVDRLKGEESNNYCMYQGCEDGEHGVEKLPGLIQVLSCL